MARFSVKQPAKPAARRIANVNAHCMHASGAKSGNRKPAEVARPAAREQRTARSVDRGGVETGFTSTSTKVHRNTGTRAASTRTGKSGTAATPAANGRASSSGTGKRGATAGRTKVSDKKVSANSKKTCNERSQQENGCEKTRC